MCRVVSRVGAIVLVLGGVVVLAFFRFTELFARLVGSQETLTVMDLRREGICKSIPQTVQFFQTQNVIGKPEVGPETLSQANRTLTKLISEVEGAEAQKSAILRTVRVQLSHTLQMPPSHEDITSIVQTIQKPGYPPDIRTKIEGILEKTGV